VSDFAHLLAHAVHHLRVDSTHEHRSMSQLVEWKGGQQNGGADLEVLWGKGSEAAVQGAEEGAVEAEHWHTVGVGHVHGQLLTRAAEDALAALHEEGAGSGGVRREAGRDGATKKNL
jgi:hypothetical protein